MGGGGEHDRSCCINWLATLLHGSLLVPRTQSSNSQLPLKMSDYGMHKQYAKCMKTRSEGHALYRNVSAAILKPGACGYFDNDGDWKTIVQTTETEELLSHKLPALQGFRTWTDGGTEEWQGPITSEGVKGHRVDLSGQGGDGNNAVGAKLEFSSSRTHSAILIAEGVVEHHQGTPETRIQEWGSANAQALIDISGDRNVIKEKGFWIVTKTFTAKRCSISMLLEKDSTSSYSIDVRSEGVKVSPTVAWWKSQRDGDWRDLAHVSEPNLSFFA